MHNKRVLIFGYWENNLGDDLFLKMFSECFPKLELFILTKKKYKDVYSSNSIKVITYDSYSYRVVNRIFSICKLPSPYYFYISKIVDTIVCLGGSLFCEGINWKEQIRNLNYSVKKCEHSYVVGSNFGPYHSVDFWGLYNKLFSEMTGICFRDKQSYSLFANLSNVRFAPDIVLNLRNVIKDENLHSTFNNYYIVAFF